MSQSDIDVGFGEQYNPARATQEILESQGNGATMKTLHLTVPALVEEVKKAKG